MVTGTQCLLALGAELKSGMEMTRTPREAIFAITKIYIFLLVKSIFDFMLWIVENKNQSSHSISQAAQSNKMEY